MGNWAIRRFGKQAMRRLSGLAIGQAGEVQQAGGSWQRTRSGDLAIRRLGNWAIGQTEVCVDGCEEGKRWRMKT